MPVATEDYIAGMRRFAAGVTIVTTRLDGTPAGLTATSVCSLTAAPPRLLACVQRDADAHAGISGSGLFAVNLLGPGHRALADRFGGREEVSGAERFAAGTWLEGATGVPLLADAVASFECRLIETVAAGTHDIFIGEVEAIRHGGGAADALLYHDRGFARLIRLG